jgi:hypothetical protein
MKNWAIKPLGEVLEISREQLSQQNIPKRFLTMWVWKALKDTLANFYNTNLHGVQK